MKIGKKLKETRLNLNLTQQEVAKKSGLTLRTISYYESIDSINNLKNLNAICNTLELTLNDIVNNEKISEKNLEKDLMKLFQQISKKNPSQQNKIKWAIESMLKNKED